jgi:hypothetical protein
MLQVLHLDVSKVDWVLHLGCVWEARGAASSPRARSGDTSPTWRAKCKHGWRCVGASAGHGVQCGCLGTSTTVGLRIVAEVVAIVPKPQPATTLKGCRWLERMNNLLKILYQMRNTKAKWLDKYEVLTTTTLTSTISPKQDSYTSLIASLIQLLSTQKQRGLALL